MACYDTCHTLICHTPAHAVHKTVPSETALQPKLCLQALLSSFVCGPVPDRTVQCTACTGVWHLIKLAYNIQVTGLAPHCATHRGNWMFPLLACCNDVLQKQCRHQNLVPSQPCCNGVSVVACPSSLAEIAGSRSAAMNPITDLDTVRRGVAS